MKEKVKLTFLRLFENNLPKFLISKRILCMHCVLSYLAKLKRGLGLTFGVSIVHDFFHKNVPYLILYQWRKFQCHTLFLSQDIKQNMLLSSYLDKWCHKLLRFSLNHPLKQWLTGKNKEVDKNTKIWISRERKELFRWNKKHFS